MQNCMHQIHRKPNMRRFIFYTIIFRRFRYIEGNRGYILLKMRYCVLSCLIFLAAVVVPGL
jgi:hypothetical protein